MSAPTQDKIMVPGTFPQSTVLFDDNFSTGFCGWEELYNNPGGASNVNTSAPLSLSTHGMFGNYSLLLQTNDVQQSTYGAMCTAIKRATYQYNPASTGLVDFECWFSYGSDNPTAPDSSDRGSAPKTIDFIIDAATSNNTTTTIGNAPTRTYWMARWLKIAGSSSITYSGQFFLTAGGVTDPSQNAIASGYYMDFPYNQNKRNLNYMKLTVNSVTGNYVSIQANDKFFDLTNCPAGAIAAPTSADTTYNDVGFGGGLNAAVNVNNLSGSSTTTASYAELHRTRMTQRAN